MNIDKPIWTTKEGHEFYSAQDLTDSHLINIFKWFNENGTPENQWPDWLKPELRRRGLWLVCQDWANNQHYNYQGRTICDNPFGRWHIAWNIT
jgi:hypothetical protein